MEQKHKPKKKRKTLFVQDDNLWRKIKAKAAREGKGLSEKIVELIEADLK